MPSERPYEKADLTGSRASLIKLVERQRKKWPHPSLNKSKVTIDELKVALLDPTNGFTTNKAKVDSPHPAKSTRHSTSSKKHQTVSGAPVETETPVTTADPDPPIAPAADVEHIEVRIYIEDSRFSPTGKTVAVVTLPVLDRDNCSLGGFRVLGKEIITELQSSSSSLEIEPSGTGTVRISVPDPEDAQWKLPFMRIPPGQAIEKIKCHPLAVEIPEDKRLKLFIDSTNPSMSALKNEAVEHHEIPLATTSQPSTSTADNDVNVTVDHPSAPDVEFLREKLADRPGYPEFLANRNRVLSNSEIVKDWRFAVLFSGDYNKIKTSTVKINKTSIQKALGIGSTWLSNAQTAVQIINKYAAVPELVEVLGKVEDPAGGSAALLRFLKEWNESHTV